MDAAFAVVHPYGLKLRPYRAALITRLRDAGWHCLTHVMVPSRGSDDSYKGVLDLVAYPPAAPGAPSLPPPVLVEIDKASITVKTLRKLAQWQGPTCGKVIILTRAKDHAPVEGVDRLVCLA